MIEHLQRFRKSSYPDPEDAARRIEEWFRRGYVMFSDRFTHSTHLRRADDSAPSEGGALG